mmetsp:Transcript_19872/g.41538  ORF Transcript_19872/g.41538 Transcript_19872/m.41538 type:complete len:83 (+) Transcript_19872:395-643(+)
MSRHRRVQLDLGCVGIVQRNMWKWLPDKGDLMLLRRGRRLRCIQTSSGRGLPRGDGLSVDNFAMVCLFQLLWTGMDKPDRLL